MLSVWQPAWETKYGAKKGAHESKVILSYWKQQSLRGGSRPSCLSFMRAGLCAFSGSQALTTCRACCGVTEATVSDVVTMAQRRRHVSVAFTE